MCVCVCVCVCVCDLYKHIFVAINELCKVLGAPEQQGAVQILIITIIIIIINLILNEQTLLHLGQVKAWAKDDWQAVTLSASCTFALWFPVSLSQTYN